MTAPNQMKHKLKVRNVSFNFDKVPKHWILNSAVATHFINSMHIVFPEGEKFFIRSVRRFAKDVKDKELKQEINSFCGQEGIHAREHQRYAHRPDVRTRGRKLRGISDTQRGPPR